MNGVMMYALVMSGIATPIELSEDERTTLETWVRGTTIEQRSVQRARIVLEAAAGNATKEIAATLQVRPATVSKWRTRFAKHRLTGLADAPRPGKPAKYDETTERRILAQLDQPPPDGFTTWAGKLVAKALGDVSAIQVWRVLRKHGIHLQGRRRDRGDSVGVGGGDARLSLPCAPSAQQPGAPGLYCRGAAQVHRGAW